VWPFTLESYGLISLLNCQIYQVETLREPFFTESDKKPFCHLFNNLILDWQYNKWIKVVNA